MFPLALWVGDPKEGERKDYNAMVYAMPQNLFNPTSKFQSSNPGKNSAPDETSGKRTLN
jgi:hypothetical protein